jgi:hypothetical protein
MVSAWPEPQDIRWKGLELAELGPLGLSEQLEHEFELVAQRETPDRVCDRRLARDHLLHVPQARPSYVRCERV